MSTARGPLTVTTESEPPFLADDGVTISRSLIRKTFSGDITGESEAQMIGAFGAVEGTAGYVAMEHYRGCVGDRTGAFALMHYGTMDAGEVELRIDIVPGSGSGDLAGISGTLQIDNDDNGVHSYVLEYSLP